MSDTSIPLSVRVEVVARRPGRGVYGEQRLAEGVVSTPYGPAKVALGMRIGVTKDEHVPLEFSVSIPTTNVPLGATFVIDGTALLEALANAYFAERPLDRPAPIP